MLYIKKQICIAKVTRLKLSMGNVRKYPYINNWCENRNRSSVEIGVTLGVIKNLWHRQLTFAFIVDSTYLVKYYIRNFERTSWCNTWHFLLCNFYSKSRQKIFSNLKHTLFKLRWFIVQYYSLDQLWNPEKKIWHL